MARASAERLQRSAAFTTHAWRRWVGKRGSWGQIRACERSSKSSEAGFTARAQPLAPPLYPARDPYWSDSSAPIRPRAKGPGLPQDMPASGATVTMANCDVTFRHMFRTYRWGLKGLCSVTEAVEGSTANFGDAAERKKRFWERGERYSSQSNQGEWGWVRSGWEGADRWSPGSGAEAAGGQLLED